MPLLAPVPRKVLPNRGICPSYRLVPGIETIANSLRLCRAARRRRSSTGRLPRGHSQKQRGAQKDAWQRNCMSGIYPTRLRWLTFGSCSRLPARWRAATWRWTGSRGNPAGLRLSRWRRRQMPMKRSNSVMMLSLMAASWWSTKLGPGSRRAAGILGVPDPEGEPRHSAPAREAGAVSAAPSETERPPGRGFLRSHSVLMAAQRVRPSAEGAGLSLNARMDSRPTRRQRSLGSDSAIIR